MSTPPAPISRRPNIRRPAPCAKRQAGSGSDWSVSRRVRLARARDPRIAVGADRIGLDIGETRLLQFFPPIGRARRGDEGFFALVGIPLQDHAMKEYDGPKGRRIAQPNGAARKTTQSRV